MSIAVGAGVFRPRRTFIHPLDSQIRASLFPNSAYQNRIGKFLVVDFGIASDASQGSKLDAIGIEYVRQHVGTAVSRTEKEDIPSLKGVFLHDCTVTKRGILDPILDLELDTIGCVLVDIQLIAAAPGQNADRHEEYKC
jgi:hypothetical protein